MGRTDDRLDSVFALVATAFVMAGDMRTMVRMVGVVTMPGHADAATIAARDKLKALASMLLDADERVDAERMSPLEHEALWWQVYDQLAPKGSAVFDGRWSARGDIACANVRRLLKFHGVSPTNTHARGVGVPPVSRGGVLPARGTGG